MTDETSALNWMLTGAYYRAVTLHGYAHNEVSGYMADSDEPIVKAYAVTHNGRVLSPEEIIARLQRLDELEEAGSRRNEIKANTPDALTCRAGLKSGGENFNDRPTSTLADLDRWERQEQGWLRYWFWRVWGTVRGWVNRE